jgi:hypothetical protein
MSLPPVAQGSDNSGTYCLQGRPLHTSIPKAMKHICFKTAALHIAVLTLASCAETPYVPPQSGEAATLKFTGDFHFVFVDEGNSCATRQIVAKRSWSSVAVRAGRRIWIEQGTNLSSPGWTHSCRPAASFEPQKGITYVSEYLADAKRCSIAVYRVDALGRRTREPSARGEERNSCLT